MKSLYLKLIDTLTGPEANGLFASKALPPVKCMDLYMGQEQDEDQFELMPLPAVLFNWSIQKERNENKAHATITLHLLYEQVRETNSLSQSKNKALKIFDWIATIDELVDGLEIDNTGKLAYEGEETVQLAPLINMITMTYSCGYFGKIKDVADKYQLPDQDASLGMRGNLIQEIKSGLFD